MKSFFLPGPTYVEPDALEALQGPVIGHRGPEIQELIAAVEAGLQQLLHTSQPVLLSTSSATAVMEAALMNTVGEHGVLHLTCGAFGEKWRKISASLGKPHETLSVEWGQSIDPEQVSKALQRRHFDAVAITHNETSTGVLNPLQEIAAVVRGHGETLLLVDAVSSMAAVDIPFDDWSIDVLLAGVQKAFALPPGFAVAAISERAFAQTGRIPHRGTYLDFLEHRRYLAKHQTPSTPSTPHLYALRHRLQTIHAEGMAKRISRHRAMAERAQNWARDRFELFAGEHCLSPTVTCIRAGDRSVQELRSSLKEQGITLGSGYGKLKTSTFRIGHMGEHDLASLDPLLQSIDRWLQA
jgi:aspartate aminotransferase-like enzyme